MKKCGEYCGVACIDGSCPNALREESPELYEDIYGTTKRTACTRCVYNNGCTDCCIAFYCKISQEQCRKEHGIEEANDEKP